MSRAEQRWLRRLPIHVSVWEPFQTSLFSSIEYGGRLVTCCDEIRDVLEEVQLGVRAPQPRRTYYTTSSILLFCVE